ncbi:MAG TPA: 30S ribosomal protein S8 [Candidatus Saccharimonadales bacterium]|jgi:small subunit ribosomal protein S8
MVNRQISTDPVADMLTRIRNAISVNKSEIILPHSSLKEAVANLLIENNFIDGLRVEGDSTEKVLVLTINRDDSSARITEITKLSKPGRRSYVNAREIPTVKQGRGIVIISTSKGVMSGEQAKTEHVGGELICQVY